MKRLLFVFLCAPVFAFGETATNNVPAVLPEGTSAPAATSPAASSTLSAPVTGTVNIVPSSTTNAPVQLTEEQKEKIRRTLKQQKLNEAQRKRAAELLDKSPVLQDKVNPGMTESQSIPKRF